MAACESEVLEKLKEVSSSFGGKHDNDEQKPKGEDGDGGSPAFWGRNQASVVCN